MYTFTIQECPKNELLNCFMGMGLSIGFGAWPPLEGLKERETKELSFVVIVFA